MAGYISYIGRGLRRFPRWAGVGLLLLIVVIFMVARVVPIIQGGGVVVPPPEETRVIPWEEARDHLGEEVYVRGPVMGAFWASESRGQPTFLNLGRDHPDPDRVTVFIPGQYRSRFEVPPEERYLGETVLVYGRLREYEGAVEVEVTDPAQIVLDDSLAADARASGDGVRLGNRPHG